MAELQMLADIQAQWGYETQLLEHVVLRCQQDPAGHTRLEVALTTEVQHGQPLHTHVLACQCCASELGRRCLLYLVLLEVSEVSSAMPRSWHCRAKK